MFGPFEEGEGVSGSKQFDVIGGKNSVTVRSYEGGYSYKGVYKGGVRSRPKGDGMGVTGKAEKPTCGGGKRTSTGNSESAGDDGAGHKEV